jgi:acyl carrier protein
MHDIIQQPVSIREAVLLKIAEIAAQQHKKLAPLSDDLPLLESGLDSLCIAILVASLDDDLDLDPFAADETATFPSTIGAFVALYEAMAVRP